MNGDGFVQGRDLGDEDELELAMDRDLGPRRMSDEVLRMLGARLHSVEFEKPGGHFYTPPVVKDFRPLRAGEGFQVEP